MSTRGWGRWELTGGAFVESERPRSVGERVFVRVVRAATELDACRLVRRRFGEGVRVRMWAVRCLKQPAIEGGAACGAS